MCGRCSVCKASAETTESLPELQWLTIKLSRLSRNGLVSDKSAAEAPLDPFRGWLFPDSWRWMRLGPDGCFCLFHHKISLSRHKKQGCFLGFPFTNKCHHQAQVERRWTMNPFWLQMKCLRAQNNDLSVASAVEANIYFRMWHLSAALLLPLFIRD